MKIIKTVNLIPIDKEKKQIYLVKKNSTDKNNGKWQFPGESVKNNESNYQAINRIIKEQLGCDTSNLKEFKKTETRVKIAVVKSQYLIGSIKGEIKLDKRKYSQAKLFEIDSKLLKLDLAFNENKIITRLLNEYKRE